MTKIKHIDGLYGEDEYKALEMLNDEKEQHALQAKICPMCEEKLIEVMQWDGPDDFEATGLECTDCDYSFGY